MKLSWGNIILTVLIAVIVSYIVMLMNGQNAVELGSVEDRNVVTLTGSSSNYVSLPPSKFEGANTTTDSALADGGATLQQEFQTGGLRKINLNIGALAGTATSTLYIEQVVSHDGTNFYSQASSTDGARPTTTITINPKAIQLDPGLASTTVSVPFTVDGHRWTRFYVYADDLASDPTDGVQAWITATLVRDRDR